MLITDRHSVHFGLFRSISIHFINLVWFGLIQSNLLQFGLLQVKQVHLVYFGQFGPVHSIWFTLVYFGQFGLVQSNRSNLVHSVYLGLFCPIWSIGFTLTYLVHFIYFISLWFNSVYLLKNRKIQVWVDRAINYLININCNYKISFSY